MKLNEQEISNNKLIFKSHQSFLNLMKLLNKPIHYQSALVEALDEDSASATPVLIGKFDNEPRMIIYEDRIVLMFEYVNTTTKSKGTTHHEELKQVSIVKNINQEERKLAY